jgi:hypothetical protein
MRKFRFLSLVFLGLAFLSASCGKKEEDMSPVQPGETEVFKDQVYKFSFKAPKKWVAESTPGTRTAYFSSQGAEVRFSKFTEGEYGAKIEVGVKNGSTKENALDEYKGSLEGVNFGNPEQATLGGAPALKVTFNQGNDDDAYMGYRIYVQKDSVVTYFEAATFGKKRMDKYKAVFALAEQSVTPGYVLNLKSGKLDSATIATLKEEARPSDRLSNYNGNGYSIEYPDNFNVRATAKGVSFEGDWKGATIVVDVIAAGQGADLAKFAEENSKKTYGGAAVSNASISGESAKVINYSMVSGVGSRAYFLMKGTNAYRITINWPKEQEAFFKPIFEKAASSFKFK